MTDSDQFTRKKYPLAHLKVKNATPVKTPDFKTVTAKNFILAKDFDNVTAVKTWDLNAIRGGKFGIGWTMNRLLWPDADAADIVRLELLELKVLWLPILGRSDDIVPQFQADTGPPANGTFLAQ